VAAIAATLMVGFYINTDRAVAGHVECEGAIEQVGQFAQKFPDGAVILFEGSEAGHWLAMPFTYIYHRSSFVLQRSDLDSGRVFAAVAKWQDAGKRVYYVAYKGLTTILCEDFTFDPWGEFTITLPQLETLFDHLPREIVLNTLDLTAYEILPNLEGGSVPGALLLIDVGGFDYGHLVSGFYPREGRGEGSYRWTWKTAEIGLPWVPRGDRLILSIRATGGYRPPEVQPAKVFVYVEGILVDSFAPGKEFEQHRIVIPPTAIPEAQAKGVLLRLETNAWVPAEVGGDDIRELGIAIDWIRLEGAQ